MARAESQGTQIHGKSTNCVPQRLEGPSAGVLELALDSNAEKATESLPTRFFCDAEQS